MSGRPDIQRRPLTDLDHKRFEARGIPLEVQIRAGLFRVDSQDGAFMVGREGQPGNYAGIAIEYPSLDGTSPGTVRLRRDEPDLERDHRNELQQRRKYLGAPGRSNRLYFPYTVEPRFLEDANVPILFTEGELKALALSWLAGYGMSDAADTPPFIAIASQGVWGWRGKSGREEGAKAGSWVEVKGPVSDLSRIGWAGRSVTIVFDQDVETNPQVGEARRQLTKELEARGAEVSWFRWPVDVAPELKGIDDFLGARGPSDTIKWLGKSRRVTRRRKIVTAADAVGDADWMADAIRTSSGAIKPLLANALLLLRKAPEMVELLTFDQFGVRTMALKGSPWNPQSREWTDVDDISLANWMQHQGCHVGVPIVNGAVEVVARENSYHPVREYLARLRWDKTPRLDRWLLDYFGVADSKYSRAVGSKWLISAVARVMEPGCQVDHCLILQGEQGVRKSTALRVMAGEWFTDQVGDLSNKDSAMQIHGVWIVEFSELDQVLSLRAETATVKAFVSRRVDRFRPPYGHRTTDFPRQCVFAGSVNHKSYLRDETGGRRFWPVICGVIDVGRLEEDRDQLWAEALVRYEMREPWWLVDPEVLLEAMEEQDSRYERDPWDALVCEWMEQERRQWVQKGKPVETWTVEIDQVLGECIKKPMGAWTQADKFRVGRIMRTHGLEYARERVFNDDDSPMIDPNGRQKRRCVYRMPSVN